MINPAILEPRRLNDLKRDVKSCRTTSFNIVNGTKNFNSDSLVVFNNKGEEMQTDYFNERGTLDFRQRTDFYNGRVIGYTNLDSYDNVKSKGVFKLDSEGRIIEKHHNNQCEEELEYDEDGNLERKIYILTGAEESFVYDENGFLVRQNSYSDEEEEDEEDDMDLGDFFSSMFGPDNTYTKYINDHNGNVLEFTTYDSDNNQITYTQQYVYNSNGDEIELKGFFPNGEIENFLQFEYEYDENQNWVKQKVKNPKANLVIETSRHIEYFQ